MIVLSKYNKKVIHDFTKKNVKVIIPGDFVGNKFKSIESLDYLYRLHKKGKIILLKGDREEKIIDVFCKKYYLSLEEELEKRNGLFYKLYFDKELQTKYIDNFILKLPKAVIVDGFEISHAGTPELSEADNLVIPDSDKKRIITHFPIDEEFKKEKNTVIMSSLFVSVFDTENNKITVIDKKII